MTIKEAIQFLDKNIPDKTTGLPDDIFYFISRTTPLVNVDLLVKDKKGRVLLSWRDDEYYGQGWHIPGSIVRFKETLEQRIQKCAEEELGTRVSYNRTPLTIEQFIIPGWNNRAHFISFLYECSVSENFVPDNTSKSNCDSGFLEWHTYCPSNFLKAQDCYRKFFN
jgi:colanic acid biosynthesis protein WcaH